MASDLEPLGLDPGQLEHAVRCRHPQVPGPVFQNAAYDVTIHQQRPEAPILESPKSATARPDPQRPVPTERNRANLPARSLLVRRVVLGAECLEHAILQPDQPARSGADPQAAVRSFSQRRDAAVAETRRVRTVENREAHAVKPRQPAPGAQPEIAVARLDDRFDRVLRQTVPGQPGVEAVLSNASGGIEAVRCRGLQGEAPAQQQPRDPRG